MTGVTTGAEGVTTAGHGHALGEAMVDRRTVLRRGARLLGGAALLGLAGPVLLEGCHKSASAPRPGTLGTLNLRLAWVPDVESGGELVAKDKGYYVQQGFAGVNLIPGGPTTTPEETVVSNGAALVAVTSLGTTAVAIRAGAALKVIGGQYQKSPYCIVSRASKPLNTPADLIGRKIGVQPGDATTWTAFLKANHLPASQIDRVAVGADPAPLAQGALDGWLGLITREPIALGSEGVPTHAFLLADYGYPEIGNVFIATTGSLKNDRERVRAAMTAEVIAWRECIAQPDEPALATVADYPTSQALAVAQEQSLTQNSLIAQGGALTNGLFYVTPATQSASVQTLALGGTVVTEGQVFDLSVLDEIYAAQPDLKPVPPQGTI